MKELNFWEERWREKRTGWHACRAEGAWCDRIFLAGKKGSRERGKPQE